MGLNGALAANIAQRRSTVAMCEICNTQHSDLSLPLHKLRAHNIKSPKKAEMLKIITENPGLTRGEYAKLSGRTLAQVNDLALRLIKDIAVYDVQYENGKRHLYPESGGMVTGPGIKMIRRGTFKGVPIDKAKRAPKPTVAKPRGTKAATPKATPKIAAGFQMIESTDGNSYAVVDGKLYKVQLIPV